MTTKKQKRCPKCDEPLEWRDCFECSGSGMSPEDPFFKTCESCNGFAGAWYCATCKKLLDLTLQAWIGEDSE